MGGKDAEKSGNGWFRENWNVVKEYYFGPDEARKEAEARRKAMSTEAASLLKDSKKTEAKFEAILKADKAVFAGEYQDGKLAFEVSEQYRFTLDGQSEQAFALKAIFGFGAMQDFLRDNPGVQNELDQIYRDEIAKFAARKFEQAYKLNLLGEAAKELKITDGVPIKLSYADTGAMAEITNADVKAKYDELQQKDIAAKVKEAEVAGRKQELEDKARAEGKTVEEVMADEEQEAKDKEEEAKVDAVVAKLKEHWLAPFLSMFDGKDAGRDSIFYKIATGDPNMMFFRTIFAVFGVEEFQGDLDKWKQVPTLGPVIEQMTVKAKEFQEKYAVAQELSADEFAGLGMSVGLDKAQRLSEVVKVGPEETVKSVKVTVPAVIAGAGAGAGALDLSSMIYRTYFPKPLTVKMEKQDGTYEEVKNVTSLAAGHTYLIDAGELPKGTTFAKGLTMDVERGAVSGGGDDDAVEWMVF